MSDKPFPSHAIPHAPEADRRPSAHAPHPESIAAKPPAGTFRYLWAPTAAIADCFGDEDRDAVRARHLRTVQDRAFVRAAWMADTAAADLDSSATKFRWAAITNGVDDDLRGARAAAEQAGIARTDISHAEQLGASGSAWIHQPCDERLSHLDKLCAQLLSIERRIAEDYGADEHLSSRYNQTLALIQQLRADPASRRSRPGEVHVDQRQEHGLLGTGVAEPPAHTQAATAHSGEGSGSDIGAAVDTALANGSNAEWSGRDGTRLTAEQVRSPEVGVQA